MRKFSTKDLTLAAVLAAVYAALTMGLAPLSYGPVQIRFSEALTVLPFFFPIAAPGLFVGCFIANLLSPYGMLDLVFGSLASLLAALWTAKMPNRWLAPMPPVLCNAVILGGLFSWQSAGVGPGFFPAFVYNGLTVGLGQVVACYGLGMVVLAALPHIPYFRALIPAHRLDRLPYPRGQACPK